MTAKQPTSDQMKAFATDAHDGPIVMINLLKFKPKAEYPADAPEHGDGATGQQAYARYGAGLAEFTGEPQIGLKMLYSGPVARFFIGEGDWDMVAVVQYPSRKHFVTMTQDPRYQAAHRHRDAGLDHQQLIETRPMGG
ncbi:MAG: DUF1330 domain-containing protein [Hyphomonas sp.]|nr:DUF1330 domain-containing protein [Hyphomonas sp.]